MRKKAAKTGKTANDDLWVSPTHTLKGDRGERSWENMTGDPRRNSRLLELADLALGLKKPTPRKKSRQKTHNTNKTEPYSQ
jgi:hypothetical protein